MFTIHRSAATG